MTAATEMRRRSKRGLASLSVALVERWMPDPFVLAVGLTLATILAALAVAPKGTPDIVIAGWYKGVFSVLGSAFQVVLILVTGHALANAQPVKRGIAGLASLARTPNQAVVLTFLVCAMGSFLNWGVGLVVAAMLSREVASRVKLDVGWLVAAAYSGWVVWATGLSSSIALTQASAGNDLNIIEKVTGNVVPFNAMVFQRGNIVATGLIVILMPIVFVLIKPRDEDAFAAPPEHDAAAPQSGAAIWGDRDPPGRRANRSPVSSWIFATVGLGYVVWTWISHGLSIDINTIIWIFLMLGIGLHGAPAAYVAAVDAASKQVGSIILQYPIYGGILGVLNYTGLAGAISKAFVSTAATHTLPFWSYICSLFMTILVPSAGGHWAVQGPSVIAAAVQVGASLPAAAMAVAAGENVAYMLQPFFALPMVAMVGIGVQRVLGYTIVTFFVTFLVWAAATRFLM